MRTLTFIVVAAMLGATVFADDDQASDPTRSPKAAIRHAHAVFLQGNLEQAIQCYHAVGVRQTKAAEIFATNDIALAKLEKAVMGKFGQEISEDLMHVLGARTMLEIDQAEENIDKNRAHLSWKDDDNIVVLIRIDGVWKYSTGAMTKDMDEEEFNGTMEFTNDLSTMADQLTKKIDEGKIAKPKQLLDAARKHMEKLTTEPAK